MWDFQRSDLHCLVFAGLDVRLGIWDGCNIWRGIHAQILAVGPGVDGAVEGEGGVASGGVE